MCVHFTICNRKNYKICCRKQLFSIIMGFQNANENEFHGFEKVKTFFEGACVHPDVPLKHVRPSTIVLGAHFILNQILSFIVGFIRAC